MGKRLNNIRRTRVSREDWLNAGLEVLYANGVDSIRVEQLAHSLGVAKSGFYWHFKNRDSFLSDLIAHWDRISNLDVINDPLTQRGSPRQRLSRIIELTDEHNLSRHDIALLAWALKPGDARDLIVAGMHRRNEFVGAILQEAGFEGEALELRTNLFVSYVPTRRHYFQISSKRKNDRMRKLFLDLLLR